MKTHFAQATVCIAGLGLMGSSLAAALTGSGSCRHVIGVARRQDNLEKALDLGYIGAGYTQLADGARHADLVILATPVRVIIDQIHQLGSIVKPGCLVMDLGSTKQDICRALDSLPENVHAIGGHPMCGKETSGIDEAEPDLYYGKVFALVPVQRTNAAVMEFVHQLVNAIGARPLVLRAGQHDRLVAAISHIPYLSAVALIGAAEHFAGEDPLVWDLAASGFRDSTRLAASDLAMMLDIMLTNRGPILAALEGVGQQLGLLRQALAEEDADALLKLLSAAYNRRKEIA